jgi:hypothetical protein
MKVRSGRSAGSGTVDTRGKGRGGGGRGQAELRWGVVRGSLCACSLPHPSPSPLQVALAVTLGVSFKEYTPDTLPHGVAILTLVFICLFVSAFAW